jgi:2-oxo-4-hydroxy-4-carboxy-5-ureidoimidazoline decarboxylase
LDRFNTAPPGEAEQDLLACCASSVWARRIAAGRPYADLPAVLTQADRATAELSWPEVLAALGAHPRIGERASGSGPQAEWSRREQAGVGAASGTALAEANRAYEERFGHVFLVFASGRSDVELLAAARERLGNDEDTERAVVRHELGRIARLRLERLLA